MTQPYESDFYQSTPKGSFLLKFTLKGPVNMARPSYPWIGNIWPFW